LSQYDGSRTALLTVNDLAGMLRIGRAQVYRLVAAGEISTVRVGTRIRFRPKDVDAYLERAAP
jgi:excisionase family DNA binding protein